MPAQSPLQVLHHYWGYSHFRAPQEEIIQSVLDGKDTMALLPTGGGKSICFQVPALCMNGLCLVISPLIALMKDQVEQLEKRGIKAVALHTGMGKREVDIVLDNCIYGNIKFLYVSPERLKTELFIERMKQMQVALLAVDEAHCISQWGYDFRPAYLEIADIKPLLNVPTIALTATATREVKQDILEKLEIPEAQVFRKSFARENLSYSAFKLNNKERKLTEILASVKGTSVVYTATRKRTRELAEYLRRHQFSANYYHGGLSNEERATKQEAWINDSIRIMVATNAFGMGIDKANVRTVIHMDLPETLEAYYQEAGRAGRDGRKAYAVALYSDYDVTHLQETIERRFIPIETVKKVYKALANFFQLAIGSTPTKPLPLDMDAFLKSFHLTALEVYNALKILEDHEYLALNDHFYQRSKIYFFLNKQETYAFQVANAKFDPLIKACLRLYGGEVFSNYVEIKEAEIAKLLGVPTKEVTDALLYLSRAELLDYQAVNTKSSVTFLQPRQKPDDLLFDLDFLKWRETLLKGKAEQVISYLAASTCRTNILQTYFDETPKDICHICDSDIKENKLNQKPPEEKLLDALEEPKSLQSLRILFSSFKEEQLTELLRLLMDEGKIRENNGVFVRT